MTGPNDTIITAYAERASGPGWANRPVWVIIEDRVTAKMRAECLQPDEQSEAVTLLYDVAESAHLALTAAVKRQFAGRVKP